MTLKPHGISFTGEMMMALLNVKPGSWPAEPLDAGKAFKFQTRRLIKHPEYFGCFTGDCPHETQAECNSAITEWANEESPHVAGQPIWAREAFTYDFIGPRNCIVYRANEPEAMCKWKPSIHMPFTAARYHGEVMRVRVERLCDITAEDAIAEGIEEMQDDHEICWRHYGVTDKTMGFLSPVDSYKSLIESIHGPDVWDKFVWVYDIKRTK